MAARLLRTACVLALSMPWLSPSPAWAGGEPVVSAASSVVEVRFPIDGGDATAFFPDDIAAGEVFSGTFDAPSGYVLVQGRQRAKAGGTFTWRVPPDAATGLPLEVRDDAGITRGRIVLRTPAAAPPETAFRFPKLIQSGRLFPVHGPFDGDSRTTRVRLHRRSSHPLVESVRRAVVRAPEQVVGPTTGVVVEKRRTFASAVRGVVVEMRVAGTEESAPGARDITIRGLQGVTSAVPIEIGTEPIFVRSDEIAQDGSVSIRKTFRTVPPEATASLVIPQSRSDEVAILLRTPRRVAAKSLALEHANAMRSLDFDPLPAAGSLLHDFLLGGDAAHAILAFDEQRGMPVIFDAIPSAGASIQLIGFDYFLGRPASIRASSSREARAAALRVLERVLSSTVAELAIYTLGLTGTTEDFPLLERLQKSAGIGSAGLRVASEAALSRLGSHRHTDAIRDALMAPQTMRPSYGDAIRLTRALRQAAFSARPELVPGVCRHLDDAVIVELDLRVDPAALAQSSLSAIVDDTPAPTASGRRSADQWRAYCRNAFQ